MSTVTKIPASISRYTSAPINAPVKRRVAAYARVSTDHEEQLTSYEAQVSYYTDYIKEHADWEFVKVYADEGLSGCSTAKREGFRQMVADALAGRLDLIITKSVSRFARNTVDSLSTIRELKEHNVECFFEKENIWTFDGRGELLISIMSSLAQEECPLPDKIDTKSTQKSNELLEGHSSLFLCLARQKLLQCRFQHIGGHFLRLDRNVDGFLRTAFVAGRHYASPPSSAVGISKVENASLWSQRIISALAFIADFSSLKKPSRIASEFLFIPTTPRRLQPMMFSSSSSSSST